MKVSISKRVLVTCAAIAALCAPASFAENGEIDYVVGQWEFNGNLNAAAGEPIEYLGDTQEVTQFLSRPISGESAQVMQFPAATPTQGYRVFHGAPPNGEGTNVNQYTIIMDIMYPAESDGTWRALLKMREDNDDADMFVASFGGIGINVEYDGQIIPNTWHRVAFAFDLPAGTVAKYIDGERVREQLLDSGVDGRWSLYPSFLIFADNDGETATGFINSLQFRDYTMTAEEIEALGFASAGGISSPGTPPPVGDVRITISRSGSTYTITTDPPGSYTLQSKPTLNAPWPQTGVSSATGMFTDIAPESTSGFYRVRRN